MVKRVKLEPDVAAEARDVWRDALDPRLTPNRIPAIGFELEENFIFIPMVDRGEFVVGVVYAFGEDLSEAEEAAEEPPGSEDEAEDE
jgi:hypothetical protein